MDIDDVIVASPGSFTRREFVGATAAGAVFVMVAEADTPVSPPAAARVSCTLRINGERHDLSIDARTTLLDLLREQLQLTGTKKGCDHGQCGACTVLANGKRINSCLSLAVMNDGNDIVTIEGLASGAQLHPMQTAFIEHDGFQCGYCTPGQICSAVAMLNEVKAGAPSAATLNVSKAGAIELSDDEIRERMSGNLCRCGAYVGIVAAIRQVAAGSQA